MTKAELIEAMAKQADLSKADAGRALDALIETVTKALRKGDKVSLVGFGTFSVTKRPRRRGRNPQTGEQIWISARKVPKFAAGKTLKYKVAKR